MTRLHLEQTSNKEVPQSVNRKLKPLYLSGTSHQSSFSQDSANWIWVVAQNLRASQKSQCLWNICCFLTWVLAPAKVWYLLELPQPTEMMPSCHNSQEYCEKHIVCKSYTTKCLSNKKHVDWNVKVVHLYEQGEQQTFE
jgi:hypothetical protein